MDCSPSFTPGCYIRRFRHTVVFVSRPPALPQFGQQNILGSAHGRRDVPQVTVDKPNPAGGRRVIGISRASRDAPRRESPRTPGNVCSFSTYQISFEGQVFLVGFHQASSGYMIALTLIAHVRQCAFLRHDLSGCNIITDGVVSFSRVNTAPAVS